jgi:hypothetical protein
MTFGESGCLHLQFLYLSTSCRWAVNCTPRSLCPHQGKKYLFDRRPDGPQNLRGSRGVETILDSTGTRNPTPLVFQPISKRYTNWAIPAPVEGEESLHINLLNNFAVLFSYSNLQAIGRTLNQQCYVAEILVAVVEGGRKRRGGGNAGHSLARWSSAVPLQCLAVRTAVRVTVWATSVSVK